MLAWQWTISKTKSQEHVSMFETMLMSSTTLENPHFVWIWSLLQGNHWIEWGIPPHLDLSHQVIPLTLHFFQLQLRNVTRSRLLGSKQQTKKNDQQGLHSGYPLFTWFKRKTVLNWNDIEYHRVTDRHISHSGGFYEHATTRKHHKTTSTCVIEWTWLVVSLFSGRH